MIDIGLSLTSTISVGRLPGQIGEFGITEFVNLESRDGFLQNVGLYGKSTQASIPTPDTPVPIVSTTGNVTVRSDNKNLIINNRSSYTYNGLTVTQNNDGSITVNGTATAETYIHFNANSSRYLPLKAGVPYTFSFAGGGSTVTYSVDFNVLNDDATTSLYLFTSASTTITPAKSGMSSVYITVKNGIVMNNVIFKPQLEVGSTATTFEKNTNSTQTLPLGTTQLCSLPNGVSDRIYKDGSTWKLEQNVASQVLSGTENWTVATSTGSPTYTYAYATAYDTTLPAVSTNSSSVMSSTMNVVGTLGVTTPGIVADSILVGTTASYGKLRAYILTSRLATNDNAGVKAWFAANPTTIQYAVRTPVTTTITDPTLITALENIRTYQGVTNITASTPISGQYYSL